MAEVAGVIGVGQIGGGVAASLARAGRLAGVYDVRHDATAGLEGVPAIVASSAALAGLCDIIAIAVIDAKQVMDVLSGPDGVLAGARPGSAVLLLSTLALSDLRAIRAVIEEAGHAAVDCGVTGGPVASATGQLVSFVGAADDVFERVRPIIASYSRYVAHMGGPGAGMAAKIARNILVYVSWQAEEEARSLAAAAGVDPRKLGEAIQQSISSGGPMTWTMRPAGLDDPDERRLRGAVARLLDKDLAAALELGEELAVPLPATALTRRSGRTLLGLEVEPDQKPGAEGDAFERGLAMLEAVYGPGRQGPMIANRDRPLVKDTVEHLFGEIWNRPHLSIKERRLLVIGATAMLGREDLIQTQVGGALANDELNADELNEMALQLAYYVGWGNSSALFRGIEAAQRAAGQTSAAKAAIGS